jgi:hypothetical protein
VRAGLAWVASWKMLKFRFLPRSSTVNLNSSSSSVVGTYRRPRPALSELRNGAGWKKTGAGPSIG